MANTGEVRIEGGRELRRTMKKAGEDMGQMKAAHADAARIAATAGAAGAPRVSGALAASVRSSGTTTAGIVRAGTARVPYANPIHWGWPARNIHANPFLTKGAQETQSRWVETYANAVQKILDRVTGE
jgi:hypothetical protein